MALRSRVDALNEVGRRRRAEDVGELLGQLVARQRRQVDAPRARVALELGEQRAQRVAAMQLVRTVAGHHHHPLVAEAASEECQKSPRRAVRPMDVLDRDEQGAIATQLVEERE
jgi:hypothetical protein